MADNFDLERIERQGRLTGALLESAIATSAALYAVIAAVYRRSPEALAHVDRVALMAVRVGEELGLAERALDDLERAAWAHDLGKLVVPDRVSGPVDVSAGDVAQWSEQVVAASDMLRTAFFLRPAAEIVLASRECMDGTGFPRRLEGEDIPLGARILHVADTYDALNSLCIALGVSADAVSVELVRHAGTRFDPDVVAACLRCSDPPPPRGAHPAPPAPPSVRG